MEFFPGAFTAEWEQRRAALLHDLSLGRTRPEDEEERRRRAGMVATAGPGGAATGRQWPAMFSRRPATGRAGLFAERPMRARFAGLAGGGQPAVVKMASFGGGARLGAMINYVSRNGAVVVENERGEELRGRDRLSAVGSEWDHLMMNRAESRDIGLFKISVTQGRHEGEVDMERARKIVRQGLGDRAFALAVTGRSDGRGFDIDGITVLRSAQGERLSGDNKATAIVQQRIDAVQDGGGSSASFRFTGYGNGTDYGSARLRSLVEAHKGKVQDGQGRTIGDGKRAGELVQLEWRGQLHSRKPRDVMHLVLSARAGTDAAAFGDAARDFLGTQFAGHRYVFSLHDAASDPKAEATGGRRPHVHVHAIIAMRSDAGDRIETTIPAFRQWRLTMAEKARAHGINMEMTDRRDRASPPAYTQNQVRPVNTIGRTEHVGTSDAAQRRYDANRSDARSFPRTSHSEAYSRTAQQQWREIADSQENKVGHHYAEAQISRLDDREAPIAAHIAKRDELPNSGSQFRTHLVMLTELVSEGDNMRHMTRPEFEAYEKRVERALFQAERAMPIEERAGFVAIATAAREHVNVRRELVALREQQDRGEKSVPRDGSPVDERDDDKQRWHDAIGRHGIAATAAANRVLVGIEQSREEMERAQAGDQGPDKVRAMKQELDTQLIRAAELGAAGNRLIREVAEADEELRLALQAVERERQKVEREKTATTSEASLDSERVVQNRGAALQPNVGDATEGGRPKQHVSRLEELQREADKRTERGRNDR